MNQGHQASRKVIGAVPKEKAHRYWQSVDHSVYNAPSFGRHPYCSLNVQEAHLRSVAEGKRESVEGFCEAEELDVPIAS